MKLAARIESEESRRPCVKASNEQLTITLMRSGKEIGLVTFSSDEIAIEVYDAYATITDHDKRVYFDLPKQLQIKP